MSSQSPMGFFLWELTRPEVPSLVGELRRLSNGDVSLQYDASWIIHGYAISPDMPLIDREYPAIHRRLRDKAAPGAVDDARPDNWGEKVIRYLHRPKGNTLIDYLYLAGDDRFGALGVSSSRTAYLPFPTPALPRLENAAQISEVSRIITNDGVLTAQQKNLAAANASLGGAKPKAVIQIDGEEWILKLFNGEPYDLPLIEHATMTLAALCGIHVAQTMPVRLTAEHALAIKRFDRVGSRRVHCLSAATLLRSETPAGNMPVYGYPHLARAIRRMGDAVTVKLQLLDLFRRMVFNILIANTDDHEKNHAVLVQQNGPVPVLRLAPAYDVVTSGNGAVAHEFLISEDSPEPLLSNAMLVCPQFDLTPNEAAKEIRKLIEVVDQWQGHFKACGVVDRDIAELAGFIDSDALRHERQHFGAAEPAKRPPNYRSPFSKTR